MRGSPSASRVLVAFYSTIREYGRTPSLLGLITTLPILFILISISVSPTMRVPVRLPIDGLWILQFKQMPAVHSIVMTTITASFIAGLSGLFLMQSAGDTDRRLVMTGYSPLEVVLARVVSLQIVVGVVTAISVAVMLVNFRPANLGTFVVGVLLVASTYGFIGMLCGAALRRLPGLYVMLFGPMMDIGVFQDPMFVHGEAATWMKLFPGYAPLEVLFDVGFTPGLDTSAYLLLAVLYTVTVGCIAIAVNIRFMTTNK